MYGFGPARTPPKGTLLRLHRRKSSMARITWTTAPPEDAAEYESVLREFAITLCPPKAKAQVAQDGAVELFIDIRPSPGALSFGRRVREQQVYIASVCGT